MGQAKTLTVRELRKVLDGLPVNKYRSRNRLMLLMTHCPVPRSEEFSAGRPRPPNVSRSARLPAKP